MEIKNSCLDCKFMKNNDKPVITDQKCAEDILAEDKICTWEYRDCEPIFPIWQRVFVDHKNDITHPKSFNRRQPFIDCPVWVEDVQELGNTSAKLNG